MGVPDTEVVSFNYKLSRSVDSKGRPSSVTQGGIVHVELTSSDADGPLAEWLANSYTEGDGTIRFVDRIGPALRQSTLKTVEFSEGMLQQINICISFTTLPLLGDSAGLPE